MSNPAKPTPAQPSTTTPSSMVQPVHFEDFGGNQFERLVFAYHARANRWLSLEWVGQVGKDKGRDIIGVREVDGKPQGQHVCVLCANWKKLTLAKIKKDLDKALQSLTSSPDKVRVICGHAIAPSIRDDAKAHAASKGISDCELWSGTEFEEHIRTHAESLLYRFVQGEPFPDAANDLLLFAWGTVPVSDDERLALISLAFDRPAFNTPIHRESSLPAFKKAIEDTIQVLNTGVWQTRQGVVIRRLPMISDVVDTQKQIALRATLDSLVGLRAVFDDLVRTNRIQHCGCGDPDCPTYSMDFSAAQDLTAARDEVVESFRIAYPELRLS